MENKEDFNLMYDLPLIKGIYNPFQVKNQQL